VQSRNALCRQQFCFDVLFVCFVGSRQGPRLPSAHSTIPRMLTKDNTSGALCKTCHGNV